MTITYRQLTLEQRYQIKALLTAGYNQSNIARELGCHRATISRELGRCPGRHYQSKLAQQASDARRQQAYKATKYTPALLAIIRRCLRHYLSPEMIAHRLDIESDHKITLSTMTIYRWIGWDYQHGGDLHHYLQRAFKRYRSGRGAADGRKHRLAGRPSIHEREQIVQTRTRCGDWEGDTMYGKGGHLVTLVDRASRYFKARKVAKRTKQQTTQSIVRMLKDQPAHTLTLDNGVEFAQYERIAKRARVKVYFADAYASWQRGSNENANGRLRRFIPRSTDLSKLSSQKLRRIVE